MAPNNKKAKLFEKLIYVVLLFFFFNNIGNILFLKLNDEYEFVLILYIFGGYLNYIVI